MSVGAEARSEPLDKTLAKIEASIKRISGTLDVLIYLRAAELPPDERKKLLAELDALKQAERDLA